MSELRARRHLCACAHVSCSGPGKVDGCLPVLSSYRSFPSITFTSIGRRTCRRASAVRKLLCLFMQELDRVAHDEIEVPQLHFGTVRVEPQHERDRNPCL